MEWVTTSGKTVEEAKDAALDELGVDEVDAEFEVLEEPRQGLFGRQRGEARVRARVRPTAPRPKIERRGRGRKKTEDTNTRSTSGSSGGAAPSGDREEVRPSEAAPSRGGGDAERPKRRRKTRGGSDEPAEPTDAAEDTAAASTPAAKGPRTRKGSGGRTRSARGNGSERGAENTEWDRDERQPAASTNGGSFVPEEELSIAEQGQIAEQFLVGLLERFGAPAQTTVISNEDSVEIQIAGQDLGLLIGPKGQTLQSLQELTRTVVQRRSVARTTRIMVDVAGYRSRRKEALERFTRQVAQDVLTSGEQRGLEPMNAADRKVVHDTVNDLVGVRTLSEGEDPRRRVVIVPDAGATGSADADTVAAAADAE